MIFVLETYALGAFIIAGIAILISVYALMTLDEMKHNGERWIKLNKELLEKVERLEKGGPTSPWKK